MIKECNFKQEHGDIKICVMCNINSSRHDDNVYYYECSGEDNCVLYQIYKKTHVVGETRIPFDVDEYMLKSSMMTEEDKLKIMKSKRGKEIYLPKKSQVKLNDDDCDAMDLELGIGKYSSKRGKDWDLESKKKTTKDGTKEIVKSKRGKKK